MSPLVVSIIGCVYISACLLYGLSILSGATFVVKVTGSVFLEMFIIGVFILGDVSRGV